jgi:Holliday junction resolvase-like predicted endonuclease
MSVTRQQLRKAGEDLAVDQLQAVGYAIIAERPEG